MEIKQNSGFSSLKEFMVTVRKVCDGELASSRLEKTAGHMESGDDAQGGFLIPEQWAPGIYQAAELEGAIVRPRVDAVGHVFPTKSDSLKLRTLVDSDRSSNIFGGIVFYTMYEAQEKASSSKITKPKIGLLELSIHKIIGGCYASNELEDDYDATFEKVINASFGAAVRFVEDDYFIWGTGVNQPLGIMNAPALITVPRTQAGEITQDDIGNMAERLLPASWDRAVFLINSDTVAQIMSLDAVENNVGNIINLNTGKLAGFPFIVTEKCESLGTEGDIILADFGHYAIADRGLAIAGSRHTSYNDQGFATDETFWRIVLRVDGQPLLAAAITPLRGANTLSAFVTLTDFVS